MIVDLDGRLVPAAAAAVSPFDGGYQYGDGIFDTLRAYAGHPFALEAHLQRHDREADLLQIPFDADVTRWRRRIRRLLEANELTQVDARVRLQISRGGGPDVDLVSAPPESIEPVVFLSCQRVPAEIERWQTEGIRLMTLQSAFARGNFPQIKSLNYLPSVMALRFARAQGFEEACLLNRQNRVLEGATSNLFLVQGETLRTPSLRLGLLPGITRSRVMAIAAEEGLKVEEGAPELRDFLLADEVLATGSVKEIVPVVQLDQSRVGEGRPGPWARRLLDLYHRDVRREASGEAAQAGRGS